jgi:hypothetical protein
MKLTFFSALLITFISYQSFAQNNLNISLNDQYKTVVDGSNNYQEYKVIKQSQIKSLWKNTIDSLNHNRQAYITSLKEIETQKNSILKLQKELKEKEESLVLAQNSVDEISFLGIIALKKSNYRIIMWSIVFFLGAIGTFLFYRTIRFKSEAKYRIKLYEEVSEEYKAYKVKASEQERKLARALQDERNKLEDHNIRY